MGFNSAFKGLIWLLIQNNFLCAPNEASHTTPYSGHPAQSAYLAIPFDHINFLASADDART